MPISYDDAVKQISTNFSWSAGEMELLAIERALGRTIFSDIVATEALPSVTKVGATILHRGHRLTVRDICVLAALGNVFVPVFRVPKVAVLTIGDDLTLAAATPGRDETRDMLSYELSAIVCAFCATPIMLGIQRLDADELSHTFCDAASSYDMVIYSVAKKDSEYVKELLAKLGRVIFSGVSVSPCTDVTLVSIGADSGVSPRKPSLSMPRSVRGTPVLGIPFQPFDAYVAAQLFARELLAISTGSYARIEHSRAILDAPVAMIDHIDGFVPVKLYTSGGKTHARPLSDECTSLMSLFSSDGILRVPRGVGELPAGLPVNVARYK